MGSQVKKGAEPKELALAELAPLALALAKKHGAQAAAAGAYESRGVDVAWRDGKLEKVTEATERGLGLELFVDGRYSMVSTSDLRPEALDVFVADAVAMAKVLAPDPHRALPDAALYADRSSADLDLEDPAVMKLDGKARREAARELADAAREVKGAEAIQSVTGEWSDSVTESVRVTSNGFEGKRRETTVSAVCSVSAKDGEGKKPEEYSYAVRRFRGDMPALAELGREAGQRALARIGQKKGKSEVLTMAVENRAAGRVCSMMLGPLSGSALQQKRSFLDGQLGKPVAAKLLSVRDEPFLPRGLASRHYDGEGISARPFPVVEAGVLRTYYIDTYYGRKLGVASTTGGASNLVVALGDKSLAQLLAAMGEGIYVTGFLGGNSNAATGDYSLGISGFRVRKGQLAEPLGEMNIGGNQKDLWKQLIALGNDPFMSSRLRVPTLVFEKIQFAGT